MSVDNAAGAETEARRFVWVGLRITQERDNTGLVSKRFLGGGFTTGASATPANAEKHFYTRDHLGSTRHVVTGTGSLAAAYEYTPYGVATKLSGTVNIDFLYTGHYHHFASGLLLAPYRALDPERGVWISRDPIKENGGLNLYGYVGNNPIGRIDPSGLEPATILGLALAAYAIFEVASTIYDIYEAVRVSRDPDATAGQKAVAIFGVAVGIFLVGPGNAWLKMFDGWLAKSLDKALDWFGPFFKKKACPVKPGSYDDKPPGWNEEWEWLASPRWRESSEGSSPWRWYDEHGGEWRRHPVDRHHDLPHWDYSPNDHSTDMWHNVDDDGNFLLNIWPKPDGNK